MDMLLHICLIIIIIINNNTTINTTSIYILPSLLEYWISPLTLIQGVSL